MADKRTFTVEDHKQKYAVRVPTVDEIRKANGIRATTFNESLGRGDLLRDQLEGELRNRKLWNDKREETIDELNQRITDFKKFISERSELKIAIVGHSSFIGQLKDQKIGLLENGDKELKHCHPYPYILKQK